ncbi:AGE family epimerase/isomerase [Microcoleus sp. S13_C5]|uniref:AGE family epimerase/isomerase n=1 Tax=Microcoleus sp. S13_C5 TaxID=3055411 RepID=UPI002FD74D49
MRWNPIQFTITSLAVCFLCVLPFGSYFEVASWATNARQGYSPHQVILPLLTSTDHIPSQLPTAQRWLNHVQNELLPFWTMPTALGDPIGNFPSIRCNDGTLLDRSNPCPEIKDNSWLMMERNYVVSISRQIYGYGVAFHLTGDPKYLQYAKAGVDYLRHNSFDRKHGGTYAFWDGETKSWQPSLEYRNPQELAYSLLGISFYYYLTRDPEVLPDILAVKDYIFKTYYNPKLKALQWQLKDGDGGKALDKHLTAQLDQMNAYMVLITPLLPETYQAEWKQDLVTISNIMLEQFYSPNDNLFFYAANSPLDRDIQNTKVDFGHTIKAMWMIRMAGLLSGNQTLVKFAEKNGPKVLERAYLSKSGSWASEINQGGKVNINKDWWIYAELDQFTASLALENPSLAIYLPQTYDYWFNYFVDRKYGEVWTGVDGSTNKNLQELPKQWPWKNAYHSFEHALMGYITTCQFHQEPVVLYYAFKQMPSVNTIEPYFYKGKIDKIEPVTNQETDSLYRIKFSDIH